MNPRPRILVNSVRILIRLGVLLTAAACIDRPLPTQSTAPRLRFNVVASFQSRPSPDTRSVGFDITYERAGAAAQPLFTAQVSLAPGQQQVSLSVDLTTCLADPLH